MKKNVVIIGAGPAGLACALGLSEDPSFNIIIIEKLKTIGGLSRTVEWNGNRMDLGGHRFFTKSDRVMQIWKEILPIQGKPSKDDILTERFKSMEYEKDGPDPEKEDRVMLIRKRISRIYFEKKFYDYPLTLNIDTLKNLGLLRISKIAFSYLKAKALPKQEINLENFFINRFGYELYSIFFKDYTKKVWGFYPSAMKAEWGVQRVKGLSITTLIKDMILNSLSASYSKTKKIETTLIRKFYYPKYGPGQMWDEIAKTLKKRGVKIITGVDIKSIDIENEKVKKISFYDRITETLLNIDVDYLVSSAAIKDSISLFNKVPQEIESVVSSLFYRDFITAGLLFKKMKIKDTTDEKTINGIIPDNWIYLQDKDVVSGRLQIFNNWSPYLVKDLSNVWVGFEFFCNEGDELWSLKDDEIIKIAIEDGEKTQIFSREDFIGGTVIRCHKAYPAYFGEGYENLSKIKDYLNSIKNFYSIGRNGMHRYNNMDHSFLSGLVASDLIKESSSDKQKIWQINTESEYLEEKSN